MLDMMRLTIAAAKLLTVLLGLPGPFAETWACWHEPARHAYVCEYDQPDAPHILIEIQGAMP